MKPFAGSRFSFNDGDEHFLGAGTQFEQDAVARALLELKCVPKRIENWTPQQRECAELVVTRHEAGDLALSLRAFTSGSRMMLSESACRFFISNSRLCQRVKEVLDAHQVAAFAIGQKDVDNRRRYERFLDVLIASLLHVDRRGQPLRRHRAGHLQGLAVVLQGPEWRPVE